MNDDTGDTYVAVEAAGPSTRAHSRKFEKLRPTRLGVLGYPTTATGYADTWEFIPWSRITGVGGVDDADEWAAVLDDVPDDVLHAAGEGHVVSSDAPVLVDEDEE